MGWLPEKRRRCEIIYAVTRGRYSQSCRQFCRAVKRDSGIKKVRRASRREQFPPSRWKNRRRRAKLGPEYGSTVRFYELWVNIAVLRVSLSPSVSLTLSLSLSLSLSHTHTYRVSTLRKNKEIYSFISKCYGHSFLHHFFIIWLSNIWMSC